MMIPALFVCSAAYQKFVDGFEYDFNVYVPLFPSELLCY